ncbi:ATPase, T2SS/T4P/T4SS family [Quisquiliibacterium transsilvanicum]|uniref:Pilus assembly protein CpaF n=1 Tax=Quisquiliibacterium transsilvanicum TaxID=1549638 RepID=A0A7W8MAE8_9BURK|nr:ATPase, T2SS/T4P/T4SS family [Quisquiliibacterium transsilvanicum]MBB5273883.1 pilus assembly protein CpaF [Quisquiliibacterium transsilvanicum]
MITITIEADGLPMRSVRVDRLPCRIGRHRHCGVQLHSWRVARVHAELHRMERGLRLVDCGSIGGTWVNGERIVEFAPLSDADEIVIAGYRLRVSGGPEAEAGVTRAHAETGVLWRDDLAAADEPPEAVAGVPNGPGVPGHRAGYSAGSTAGVHAGASDAPRTDASLPRQHARPVDVEWRRLMHRRLLQTVDLRRKDLRQLSSEQLRAETRELLGELIAAEPELPAGLDLKRLLEDVLDEAIGLGPLERLLADPDVSEIMVNRADEIYVEREGRLERTAAVFSSEDAVRAVIDRIVSPIGRRIDESSPMVDARLADGSRVNAVIPPLAIRGSTVTIRRFNRQLLAPSDLQRLGSASPEMLEFLRLCVAHRRNVVISGGTGSGKTTLLNVLSNLIPSGERIVTIEDAAELRLAHPHLVSLEARPSNAEGRGAVSIRDLVRNALRMRPDRIVVGECRGGEALDMLQAMNTGHDGSLTTIHANSPRDVVARLETMVLMAGMDLPVAAIRDQIASAVHLIVQQARAADGRRRIVEIAEVTGMEGSRVLMQPVFRWERGRFVASEVMPQFFETLRAAGHSPAWGATGAGGSGAGASGLSAVRGTAS